MLTNGRQRFGGMILVMAIALLGCQWASAAALTEGRNTPFRDGEVVAVGVYTNTRIFAGAMVALNSSGYAIPAVTNAGTIVIGRAEETVDNRSNAEGAGDSGALTIDVRRGVFGWENNAGVTDADIGSLAYAEDDNSVDDDDPGGSVIAGVIVDVDADYVWVDTYHVGRTVGSFTTLAASGNATVGGTLGVTGAAALSSTLTVTGTVSGTGLVKGATLGIGSTGVFAIANTTQLVFTAGAVTNVIDADITN